MLEDTAAAAAAAATAAAAVTEQQPAAFAQTHKPFPLLGSTAEHMAV